AADVQAFTCSNDISHSEFDFLAADTQAQILRTVYDVEENLMQIGDIFINQAQPTIAPFLQATLELREKTEVRSEVPVDVKKIALQNVSRACLGIGAKAGVFIVFIAVTNFAADGEVPVFASQGDVFQIVKNFFFAIKIGEQTPVFL